MVHKNVMTTSAESVSFEIKKVLLRVICRKTLKWKIYQKQEKQFRRNRRVDKMIMIEILTETLKYFHSEINYKTTPWIENLSLIKSYFFRFEM